MAAHNITSNQLTANVAGYNDTVKAYSSDI